MIPDKESDIKPRFHKTKTQKQKHVEDGEVRSNNRNSSCTLIVNNVRSDIKRCGKISIFIKLKIDPETPPYPLSLV